MTEIKVIHIDTGREWRGGQQQAFYLHKALAQKGIKSLFICRPDTPLHEKLINENLNHYAINIRGELDFFSGRKISKICRNQGYNILHLHDAHSMALGLWAKVFSPEVKLIGVRRVDYHIKKSIFSKFKYQTPKMDRIVAISEEIKRILIKDEINPDKIEVIKSGVDINKFNSIIKSDFLIKKLGLPETAFIVGTVAALAGHKDYPNFLKAAEIISKKEKNIYFVSIGDGPDKNEIFKLKEELELDNRFIFEGFQKEVGQYLKNFNIFVLSSKTEGLGTSVMDAMAAGLPCVCCASGGIPELIINEKDGLLVEKQNPELLAEKILELYYNNDLRNRLSKNAAEKAKEFSIDYTVEKNIGMYEKIIG